MMLSQRIAEPARGEIIAQAACASSSREMPLVIRDELLRRGWRPGEVSLAEIKSILQQALLTRRILASVNRRINVSLLHANPPFGRGGIADASEVASGR